MRSSGIGNWGNKMMAQILDCYQQGRDDALWREGSGQYLTLWPTETLISVSAACSTMDRRPQERENMLVCSPCYLPCLPFSSPGSHFSWKQVQ